MKSKNDKNHRVPKKDVEFFKRMYEEIMIKLAVLKILEEGKKKSLNQNPLKTFIMNKDEILKTALFEIKIVTPTKTLIDVENISYDDAIDTVNVILLDNKHDHILQEELSACLGSFGFRGFAGRGGYSITISAGRPIKRTGDKMTCPERINANFFCKRNDDEWELRGDDKCCSYCGSLHPDRVIELIKERGPQVIEFTSKSYKIYVTRPEVPNAGFGGIKYYRWHDTDELRNEFKNYFGEGE